jgi:hypothetical protein
MSIISTAICRSFLLWWHLGIEPMIGAGPMRARAGWPKCGRTHSAGDRCTRLASQKDFHARPVGERADAA